MNIFRVSEVETFRQWMVDPDAEYEVLMSRLRGTSLPTEAMAAGAAFHKALELAQHGEVEVLEADGYTFEFLTDAVLQLPEIRELRASKVYTVDEKPITITGQVDCLEGQRIEDHKTTSSFSPDRYLEGYQWRLYLEIFKANQFRWNVFEIKDTGVAGFWDVRNHHTLEQFRYPVMSQDCQRLVNKFARFVREHLPERCS